MRVCVYKKKSINLFWGVCFSATHSFADEIWVFVNNNQNWTGVPWHGLAGILMYIVYISHIFKKMVKHAINHHKP